MLVGRILFGGYFLMMGLNHFMKMGMLSGYAQSKGVPMPKIAVAGSGLLLLAGGLGYLFNQYVIYAGLALILFLIPVTFQMHAFWRVKDPQMKMSDMTNFMKNLALLGAVLMTAMA